jgi:hypothetical protein
MRRRAVLVLALDGLVADTVALPSPLHAGRTRTVVTTYDYRAWGQPIDLTS